MSNVKNEKLSIFYSNNFGWDLFNFLQQSVINQVRDKVRIMASSMSSKLN